MNELSWRMLRGRVASGRASGVLCRPDEVSEWLARLEALPLCRGVDEETASYYTGATVAVRTSAEAARDWDRASSRSVVWLDEADLLEADLPAPKAEREE